MRKKHKIMYENKEYYGGGVILYHGKKVLLQKVSNKKYWEDFGGRTDKEDPHIIETAFREASEESNGIITKEFLEDLIKKNKRKCYRIPQDNTYFVYLIYVPKKIKDEMTKEFIAFYGKNILNQSKLINGVKDFLTWCKNEKISMAVCTNKTDLSTQSTSLVIPS